MSTIFHIIRASIFLMLASFASTALSVTVNSESGGASINGAWSFGCSEPDSEENELYDQSEYLIFSPTTVESRVVLYTSTNGGCNLGVVGTESETFDFTVEDDLPTEGWVVEEEDILEGVDPPPRQDGDGLLNPTPLATELAILILGDPAAEDPEDQEDKIERILFYIDDTGEDDPDKPWLLWRNAGEDDAPTESLFMLAEEPLTKTDLQLSPIPVPAAFWLFGTALIGFVGISRRRKVA